MLKKLVGGYEKGIVDVVVRLYALDGGLCRF